MSFSSILDSIDKYIRLPAWLQFVGLALATIALALLTPVGFLQHVFKVVGLVGCFVSFAGFIYDKIYP